jgi:hypothetical protein
MGERVLAVTNAASAHPCDADLEADMEYVDRIDITLAVFCAPPSPGAVNSATMFATMKQALTSLGPVPFDAYGDGGDVYKLDPCSLPGGSDLPGAVLTYGVVISKPVPTKYFKSFHLPDDTTPPVLSMTPPTGTLVHPGQVIEVHVTATDATDQGPKFGIQYIQLLKDPSGLIGSKDYGNHSTACDTSRLTKTFTTTYTVPDNPGPVVTLTALSADFGSTATGSVSVQLPTAGVQWTGTIGAVTARRYLEEHAGPYSCHDAWHGTLSFVVLPDKTITGSGAMTKTLLSCNSPYGMGPSGTAVSFSVMGTRSSAGLTLVLGHEVINGPSLAGVTSLFNGSACMGPDFKPVGPPLRVPFTTDPHHASGTPLVQTAMGADCGGSKGDPLTANTTIALTQTTK